MARFYCNDPVIAYIGTMPVSIGQTEATVIYYEPLPVPIPSPKQHRVVHGPEKKGKGGKIKKW